MTALATGQLEPANRRREEPVDKAKPFSISKREVWEAFKRVKANQGAAGVDGQSIADFEANLSGNLYKLWNRLWSGSYFPPPVRRVDIPKASGGTRRWVFRHGLHNAPCSVRIREVEAMRVDLATHSRKS